MHAAPPLPDLDARRIMLEFGLGFLYWLAFVLMLEPGNLLRWPPTSAAAWSGEVLRLAAAGILGAAATPAIVAMSRRLPIERPHLLRRGGLHLGFVLVTTVILIVTSCVLAPLLPHHVHRPLGPEIGIELAANGPLVAAWIAGLAALAHAVGLSRSQAPSTTLTVRQRGHSARLDLAEVAWIETQGNYLALHGAAGARLVRATAKALEAELDATRFFRIHRRTFVALQAVRDVRPLAAGDALLHLVDGTELRVSRTARARLMAALDAAKA